jgi:hypothetical protein
VVEDEKDEDDLDVEGPDTLPNALRFAVMGRPQPAGAKAEVRFGPNTVGALIAQARREAEPQGALLGRANASKRATRY